MIFSMTGFARIEKESEAGSMVLELRTVNHRYLDISFRMPEELRAFEGQLREKLQKRLSRGKVECNLRFTPALTAGEIAIDERAVKALLGAVNKIENLMSNAARMPALDILRWPGIVQEQSPDKTAVSALLMETIDEGLDRLLEMRELEGRRMAALLVQRLDQISEIAAQVRKRRPEVVKAIREKLQARLQLLEADTDPGRLEQEMALIAQKLDVDEELDRLDSHIKATREVLTRNEPVGRRLDFLMQEFNREANTLSSKAADGETTQAAVEMKVLIEQMREQVQNIE